ncbi:nitroreductase family deazaflavin-dependent oxidoreductase [Micromonospora sp. Llam7]|uniref:nitroreductase/quinone reductase family protein n=1 Tax=Micromonospora tarapacensis TaxID=2835305 RepID=UPI001C82A817|nr:nitroreductase/quinone reductase family protein [Micromonospora tarapacensis]MBX7265531.1 nitroreductase family deazaflavin-dependent oxidoreductase [Micromonospora tarapacensis]
MTENADAGRGQRVPAYRRPGWFVVRVANPLMRWLGAASTLDVPRRITGTRQRVPVNILELDGQRYLVSVRGRTEWVRNLRAAGHCTVRHRGRHARYRAVEISGDPRERTLAAYRHRWGAGPVRRLLDELPDPADHPTFRLDPAE